MLHRKLRLMGYVRSTGCSVDIAEQRRLIEQYCHEHHHHLVGFAHVDEGDPGLGLQGAITSLHSYDGLIAYDLNRFVHSIDDRVVELRALLERLLHEGKVLITLVEGIETLTAAGQETVIELLYKLTDGHRQLMTTLVERRTTPAYRGPDSDEV